ncbi:MAG: UMP kinase [Spirochaetaceae bacterium]|nr:MAG: UMP kinase [Spirochaetaceae bacterium]
MTVVISVGGSIIAPDEVDSEFVRGFCDLVRRFVATPDNRMILVCGGGAPARRYQQAYRRIAVDATDREQDLIGIAATRLNASLLHAALADCTAEPLVTRPDAVRGFSGSVLISGGWKPGFSTDFVAVTLAESCGARTVVNLSNIDKVYSADPRVDPEASPLDTISWPEFQKLVGTEWVPGANLPFDPIATRRAAELGLTVIAAGKDLANLELILAGKPFFGTTIGGHAPG